MSSSRSTSVTWLSRISSSAASGGLWLFTTQMTRVRRSSSAGFAAIPGEGVKQGGAFGQGRDDDSPIHISDRRRMQGTHRERPHISSGSSRYSRVDSFRRVRNQAQAPPLHRRLRSSGSGRRLFPSSGTTSPAAWRTGGCGCSRSGTSLPASFFRWRQRLM